MLVMIMTIMMVVMVMMVVLVEYHDQNKMLSLEPYHFSNTLAKCQISHSRIDWGHQVFCFRLSRDKLREMGNGQRKVEN